MQLLRDAGRSAPPGTASAFVTSSAQADCLQQAARRVANKQLQQLLPAGIGFHNAGLDAEERTIVEGLFLGAHLSVRINVLTCLHHCVSYPIIAFTFLHKSHDLQYSVSPWTVSSN